MLTAIDLSPACEAPTGIGRYITDLCTALNSLGQAPLGVYRGHRGAPAASLGATCIGTQRYDLLGGRIGFRVRLPGILRQRGVTVYHATTTLGTPRGFPCPVVATIHDLYPLLPGAFVSAAHRRQFASALQGLLATSRLIICPTQTVAGDLARLDGKLPPIRVIPHGVSVPSCSAPRPREAPYVLTMGAIESRKGYDRMAAHWRRPGNPHAWIHLGPVRHDPAGRIQSAMRDAGCCLLGYVDEATRIRWLLHAEALLQPSLHEGFGYPPLEAMALGVPVIARPIPAALELLDDAPIWQDDDRGWSDSVNSVRDSTAHRQTRISRGRAVAGRYTVLAMANAHCDAYAEACP